MEYDSAPDLSLHLLELIRMTSCEMPEDVVAVLRNAMTAEDEGSSARGALQTILDNIELAKRGSTPVCQDTGTPNFYLMHPLGYSSRAFDAQIKWALAEATRRSYLRPNAVDSLTGKNSGDNSGIMFPTIHYEEWERDRVEVRLMLKGGGCENVSAQASLPNAALKAGRDLEGVSRVVLEAVFKAQGQGCSPGILGVAIGGDRATSHIMAKKQLFRRLDDVNPNPELAALEKTIYEKSNAMGIGPMGFGGRTTVLGVKIGALHRLPACYFVSIAYMCWAHRRHSMTWQAGEVHFD